jgi:hypothetical protein
METFNILIFNGVRSQTTLSKTLADTVNNWLGKSVSACEQTAVPQSIDGMPPNLP